MTINAAERTLLGFVIARVLYATIVTISENPPGATIQTAIGMLIAVALGAYLFRKWGQP